MKRSVRCSKGFPFYRTLTVFAFSLKALIRWTTNFAFKSSRDLFFVEMFIKIKVKRRQNISRELLLSHTANLNRCSEWQVKPPSRWRVERMIWKCHCHWYIIKLRSAVKRVETCWEISKTLLPRMKGHEDVIEKRFSRSREHISMEIWFSKTFFFVRARFKDAFEDFGMDFKSILHPPMFP